MDEAVMRRVRLVNRQGLHARPISQFVQIVTGGRVQVTVTGPDGTRADASSAFSMMTLAAAVGSELTIEAEGPDAQRVMTELERLVADGFGED